LVWRVVSATPRTLARTRSSRAAQRKDDSPDAPSLTSNGAPPPPPPPPPPSGDSGGGGGDGTAALFAQLNQGGAVTSGLKKVVKGETWDPTAYKGSGAKKADAAPKAAAAKPVAAAKPPKLALDGKKWVCEHQVKQSSLTIDAEVKQTVYVYQCTDSVLTVNGKCNAITLDGCKKMAIVFDTVVAGIELINCTSCKVQVKDKIMTVTVDKCNGTQLILTRESLDCEIISAKSSELNIVVPGENENDEFKEFAIPEQFVSKWDGTKWVTVSMAHTG